MNLGDWAAGGDIHCLPNDNPVVLPGGAKQVMS